MGTYDSLGAGGVSASRRNLRWVIAQELRSAIFSGQLRAGHRIDMPALAERFEVSQLPVREALISLEGEGLLRSLPRRGYYVEELDVGTRADHDEVIGFIYELAVARAAEHVGEEELRRLAELANQLQSADSSEDRDGANGTFYSQVLEIGLTQRLRLVVHMLATSLHHERREFSADLAGLAAKSHGQLVEALRRHDAKAARLAAEAEPPDYLHRALEWRSVSARSD